MGEARASDVNILEEVQKIYSDVSEWLKFLEAKHAGTFAVWTALLIAVITSDFYSSLTILWKTIFILPILLGSLINLVSFIPFLNKCKYFKKKAYNKYKDCTDNAVFYQAIFVKSYPGELNESSSAVAKYIEILKTHFGIEIQDTLTIDYVKQIVDVSTVATIKAYLFSVSVTYTLLIIVIVMAGMIIA